MAYPDTGPLLDEQLDELELLCRAAENDGNFEPGAKTSDGTLIDDMMVAFDYVLWWHDRHDRKLLEVARWALANGWRRETT